MRLTPPPRARRKIQVKIKSIKKVTPRICLEEGEVMEEYCEKHGGLGINQFELDGCPGCLWEEKERQLAALRTQLAAAEARAEGMRVLLDSLKLLLEGHNSYESETKISDWNFRHLAADYIKKIEALLTPAAGEWVTDYGNKYKHHATTAVEDKKANGTALGKDGEE